jgi:hypothetical protein
MHWCQETPDSESNVRESFEPLREQGSSRRPQVKHEINKNHFFPQTFSTCTVHITIEYVVSLMHLLY